MRNDYTPISGNEMKSAALWVVFWFFAIFVAMGIYRDHSPSVIITLVLCAVHYFTVHDHY